MGNLRLDPAGARRILRARGEEDMGNLRLGFSERVGKKTWEIFVSDQAGARQIRLGPSEAGAWIPREFRVETRFGRCRSVDGARRDRAALQTKVAGDAPREMPERSRRVSTGSDCGALG